MTGSTSVVNRPRIGLDNPIFSGRLRGNVNPANPNAQPNHVPQPAAFMLEKPVEPVPLPQPIPGVTNQEFSEALAEAAYETQDQSHPKLLSYASPTEKILLAMAAAVFLIGVVISIQTWQANRNASAQLSAIAQELQ